MKERLTTQFSVYLTESVSERIQAEADRLGASISEIIRDCVENDLPRLKERNRKRIKKRKTASKSSRA